MLPQPKHVCAITPISKTNGATATGETMDMKGYRHATITVVAATADVVSNKPTVLKLQEADVTNTSSFADISGAVGGTDFTIANAKTDVPNVYGFHVDLRKRKRYLRVLVSPQTTQVIAGAAQLHKGEEAPITATQGGIQNLVEL